MMNNEKKAIYNRIMEATARTVVQMLNESVKNNNLKRLNQFNVAFVIRNLNPTINNADMMAVEDYLIHNNILYDYEITEYKNIVKTFDNLDWPDSSKSLIIGFEIPETNRVEFIVTFVHLLSEALNQNNFLVMGNDKGILSYMSSIFDADYVNQYFKKKKRYWLLDIDETITNLIEINDGYSALYGDFRGGKDASHYYETLKYVKREIDKVSNDKRFGIIKDVEKMHHIFKQNIKAVKDAFKQGHF